MVDKKLITDINSAKNHNQYDGGGLDDAQKLVFDQPAIPKGTDGIPKIIELQEVAETLEKVIKAKKATAWNKTLYDELNARKTANDYAYQAINYNGQYEAALTNLKSKETPQAPTPGTTEAAIQAEIDALKIKVVSYNNELDKVQARKSIDVNLKSEKLGKVFEIEQAIKKIEELKLRLRNQEITVNTGAPIEGREDIVPILNASGANVNKPLRDMITNGKTPQFTTNPEPIWESNLGQNSPSYLGFFHGRRFIWKEDARELNFQIMNFLKKIDNDKMEQAIDKYVTDATNNTLAKGLWKDIKGSEWFTKVYPASHQNSYRAGTTETFTEKVKNGEGNLEELAFDSEKWLIGKDEGWADQTNFFRFMRIVFPRAAASRANIVKELELGDDKKSSVHLRSFSKNPYDEANPKITTNRPKEEFVEWFAETFTAKKSELIGEEYNGTGKGINLEEHINIFYNVYPERTTTTTATTVFSDTVTDTDFSFWKSGTTFTEAKQVEKWYFTEWIKAIRNAGYTKDIVSDKLLSRIYSENSKYTENYFENVALSQEGKKKYIAYWSEGYNGETDYWSMDWWGKSDEQLVITGNNLTVTRANDDPSGYLWIPGFDLIIKQRQSEKFVAQSEADAYNGAITKLSADEADLISQRNALEAEIAEKEKKLAEFKTKGLEDNIKEWNKTYGAGPGSKIYTNQEIWELEKRWGTITEQAQARQVTIASIDADIETKQANFDVKVTKFLPFYVNEVTTILNGAKTNGERTKDLSQQQLTLYKGYLDKIKTVRELTSDEQGLYEVIEQRIKGTYRGDEIPTSDLTGPTLLNLLGAKDGTKESDVRLAEWKATTKFRTITDIKLLIDSVRPAGVVNTSFQDHLAAHDSWGINKIAKGDDQWDTFIKNKPEHVIGAIKLFTDYESKLPDSKERKDIDAAIDEANNNPKADETDKWDKTDKKHLSEFLYKKAEGKTGEGLIKKLKVEETPTTPTSDPEKPWWDFGTTTGKVLWIGGGSVLVIGVLAVIFWKNISEWWNGPTEEEGKGQVEEKNEDEENE